ncbi:hypothetical protein LL037_21055 [Clostridium estertheticum]|uniref:hypothetical protein n=1 Tax=Clostridium estertheticum TaxID=238834 RepID=UPI001C0C2936|nr:hypothetical protein [Clostridium estertheticum]MBU3200613.1 hypothetical protein [Clostridium estertheticum]WAG64926.1 hypothetical protein LL037_21055 [Clostridium estertheticum]
MKQNIVLIETVENVGTGIIYPCSYDKVRGDCNSFIVFTNRHVLNEIGKESKIIVNQKKSIILQIFDDEGKIIPDEDIKEIKIYNKSEDLEYYNDIAAMLVLIDNRISITLETKILQEELEDRDIVYMEGYPGVMLEDEISQKVQLEGRIKTIFPINNYIGVYQISDDYHWYNNYKDLKLMEGFSGSPVYKVIDRSTFILGMNQSIANIENGENPFKLVYYLKMQYILDYLREVGCIIYGKIDKQVYQIEWIYGHHEEIRAYKNKPTFLLLGGSGAGKSSFAKDFALHGKDLNATNDGQTTRTNVIYNFSIFCEENEAEIELMSSEEFCKRMKQLNGIKPILFVYHKLFGFTEFNNNQSNFTYLENLYYFVECILLKKSRSLLNDIDEILLLRESYDVEKLLYIYKNVAEILLAHIPLNQVKFICDKDAILKLYKTVWHKNQHKQLFANNSSQINEMEEFQLIVQEIWKDKLNEDIEKILFEECKRIEFNYKRYQVRCYQVIKNEREFDNNQVKEYIENRNIRRELYNIIATVNGFFDISEFQFIFSNAQFQNAMNEWKEPLIFMNEKNKAKLNIDKVFEEACKGIYEKLDKSIKERLKIDDKFIRINLKETTKEQKELITMCLQVKNGKSLTGMIKSVKVRDSISNEYALLMKELKISELTILDTYGLDHVEWEAGTKYALQDIVYQYRADKSIPFKDIGVLYIKKLDSGRPDELKNILPYVYETIPQAPVYCVFSGIDIFYSANEKQIAKVNWNGKNEVEYPKSVQYILSNEGRDEITKNIRCSDDRKLNFYLVLKNNLIAYCGRKELVKLKHEYYENNIKQIRKLLTSMIMKEFSSLEIVDKSEVTSILQKENVKRKAIILLAKVFEKASISAWYAYHWKTTETNYTRITKRNELGFWGVKHHQWNQLFHEAFTYVMSEENSEFLKEFEHGKDAIEAAMINMETKFLGNSDTLYLINLEESEKNEFRKLLEKMYQLNVYIYNPFNDTKNNLDEVLKGQFKGNRIYLNEYLNDVVNFLKGFKANKETREEFFEFFKSTLLLQIEEDNNAKSENLINLNTSFLKALKALEGEFIMKYDNKGTDEARDKFNMLLNYYFESKQ